METKEKEGGERRTRYSFEGLNVEISSRPVKTLLEKWKQRIEIEVVAPQLKNYENLSKSIELKAGKDIDLGICTYDTDPNRKYLYGRLEKIAHEACTRLFLANPTPYNDQEARLKCRNGFYYRFMDEFCKTTGFTQAALINAR